MALDSPLSTNVQQEAGPPQTNPEGMDPVLFSNGLGIIELPWVFLVSYWPPQAPALRAQPTLDEVQLATPAEAKSSEPQSSSGPGEFENPEKSFAAGV